MSSLQFLSTSHMCGLKLKKFTMGPDQKIIIIIPAKPFSLLSKEGQRGSLARQDMFRQQSLYSSQTPQEKHAPSHTHTNKSRMESPGLRPHEAVMRSTMFLPVMSEKVGCRAYNPPGLLLHGAGGAHTVCSPAPRRSRG